MKWRSIMCILQNFCENEQPLFFLPFYGIFSGFSAVFITVFRIRTKYSVICRFFVTVFWTVSDILWIFCKNPIDKTGYFLYNKNCNRLFTKETIFQHILTSGKGRWTACGNGYLYCWRYFLWSSVCCSPLLRCPTAASPSCTAGGINSFLNVW